MTFARVNGDSPLRSKGGVAGQVADARVAGTVPIYSGAAA